MRAETAAAAGGAGAVPAAAVTAVAAATAVTVRLNRVRLWDSDELIDVIAPLPGVDLAPWGGFADETSADGGFAGEMGRDAGPVRVLDGDGLVLAPGLVDLHVHFRDPGQTAKEDMQTGSAAAAAGGFTDVCLQPNTLPAADGQALDPADPASAELLALGCRSVLDYLEDYECLRGCRLPVDYSLAAAASVGRAGLAASDPAAWSAFTRGAGGAVGTVGPAGIAATDRTQGSDGNPVGKVIKHPVVALSDDGSSVSDQTLDQVLDNARRYGLFLMDHCERHERGVMNQGETADQLGVEGVPAATELAIVKRDIEAARRTGVHVHLQHVSTAAAFAAVRAAKREGLPVTCETAPHYFVLSDSAVAAHGAMAKMNPPLRSEADRLATLEAIADGTVDCLATDHAPHTSTDKAAGLVAAPNGIIGLETAYALAVTYLVEPGLISHQRLIDLMSLTPAALIGLDQVSRDWSGLLVDQPSRNDTISRRVLDLSRLAAAGDGRSSGSGSAGGNDNDSAGSSDSDGGDSDQADNKQPITAHFSLLAPRTHWTVDSSRFRSKARNTPFDGLAVTGRPIATILGPCLIDGAGLLRQALEGSPVWKD